MNKHSTTDLIEKTSAFVSKVVALDDETQYETWYFLVFLQQKRDHI